MTDFYVLALAGIILGLAVIILGLRVLWLERVVDRLNTRIEEVALGDDLWRRGA